MPGVYLTGGGGLPTSGGNMNGDIDMNDHVIIEAEIRDYVETVVVANSGAAYEADLADGNSLQLTLTANCTLTFANPPTAGKAGSLSLFVFQDATGSRTITWPASLRWANGYPPTLSTATNSLDVIQLVTIDGGVTWLGFLAGANMS